MMDRVRRELPSVASSAAVARQAVAEALRLAGFHGDVDAAVLLTSELVTNAIRHAQPPLAIEVVADATTATVKVSDGDVARLPVLGPHTSTALAGGGRGLRIVDRLASQWGVELGGSSKTVWFTAG